MARARNIKPAFFKNEYLAELPPTTRLLFIGLWTLADKEGRLEKRLARIRAEIFPYEYEIDVKSAVESLEEKGFLHLYTVDGVDYIQVINWHKHQKPHHMEVESVIPSFNGEENKFKAKPIYKKQRERILNEYNNKCARCGATSNLHIDHIVPVSKGGTSEDSNLQVLCQSCNCSKGAKVVDESLTNGGQVVRNGSYPTDTLNPIPDSLNTDSLNAREQVDPMESRVSFPTFKTEWRRLGLSNFDHNAAEKEFFEGCHALNMGLIIESLPKWAQSKEWTEENGRFQPKASKFLADRKYEEEPKSNNDDDLF